MPVFSRAASKPCSKCMDRGLLHRRGDRGRVGVALAASGRLGGSGGHGEAVLWHAEAAAPTGLTVVTMEINRAGSLRMGKQPRIKWCDHTFNPWMSWSGCTKVGPACDHCYAGKRQEDARYGRVEWGGPTSGPHSKAYSSRPLPLGS